MSRERASARSPGRESRRARPARRPASAAETFARPPENRRGPRPTSAEITPTSVTRGKSCPLAIICVPTSTSSSRRANFASSALMAPRRLIVSRSTRATRAPGKALPDFRLDALGAEANLLDELAAAVRAGLGQRRRVVAVVAARAVRRAMHRQRHAAVRTVERRAALPAEDRRREPAPVEQDNRLLASRQRLAPARSRGWRSRPRPGPRRHTPGACRRCGRRRADDRGRGAGA